MSANRVLITGGAGFIGSHLADLLISKGNTVSIIDDFSGGHVRNVPKNARVFSCDLRNTEEAASIIEQIKPSILFHLAANAAENKAQFSPIDITSRNYSVFINTLVPAIRSGLKRIVVTSSIAVYGVGTPPFKEVDIPVPHDLYGLSKHMMEETLHILSKVHDFEYVITRPHNVYGPRQSMTDPYRNVVSLFLNSVLNNKPYFIYGSGDQQRCFSYIDEVVSALANCAVKPVSGSIFNIGSDTSYTINELSAIIKKVTKTKLVPIYLPERPQEVTIVTADHTLAKNELDYADTLSLHEGISKTWEYAKKIGPQVMKFTPIELNSTLLPKNWVNGD